MEVKKKPIYIKLGDTIVDYSNKFSDDEIFQKDSYESEEEEIEHACQRWCCTKGCLPGNTLKEIKDKWIKIENKKMQKQNEENLKTLPKEFITRELWLKTAVRMIDEVIFEGQLPDKEFQISCGRTPSERVLGECITIRDDMKIEEEDRFPITIHINEKIKDPIELIATLVHECIHGFHGIRGHGKAFASVAHNIGFGKPYKEYYPTTLLLSNVELIYSRLVLLLGDFPHKPIVTQVGEPKERKKNTYTLFCDCGFECTAKKDMVEKFGIPTCACGKKMGVDYEEGKEE